jgi:hypothetical protein
MKRHIIIFLLALFIATDTDAQKYFKVLDATIVHWTGGIRSSGTGETYSLKILVLTNDSLSFNGIWIGKDAYGIPELLTPRLYKKMLKGDTILVQYTIHHYPSDSHREGEATPTPRSSHIKYTGDGLLEFTVGKAARYRTIKSFRTLSSVNYQ